MRDVHSDERDEIRITKTSRTSSRSRESSHRILVDLTLSLRSQAVVHRPF